ncbi:mutS protein homolog 5-like isoform X3 [Dreissena polymorpha]|uniref:mutS protein homolog 5-like isoform X3 n=1 Tax=Dreissena polymorpha TaxID=45954 RepID=UPI00226441B3|nr:mutS protein homolog 5-like isoform X3 [Dreissena polymorpha]
MDATPAKRRFAGPDGHEVRSSDRPGRPQHTSTMSMEVSTPYLSVTTNGLTSTSELTSNSDRASSSSGVQTINRKTFTTPSSRGVDKTQNRSRSTENVFVREKQKGKSGSSSKDTPSFLNQETPLILATAKQVGSAIMTSCNTESIRHLLNPYSECFSTTSSEYFQKNKPFASSTPVSRSRTMLSSRSTTATSSASSGTEETEDMEDSDVAPVRRAAEVSNESEDSQVYMGLMWHGGRLGVAYYDLETTLLHVMMDSPEDEGFKLLNKLLEEVKPGAVIVSSKLDQRMMKVLTAYGEEHGLVGEDRASPFIQLLPSIDFSGELCKNRLLALDLPYIPEHYTYDERLLYITSLIPLDNGCMVRATGGLIRYLEKKWVGIELEEAGTKLPVLDVKIFSLDSQMILDETAYSALQIFQRESHPSVYKLGTSNAGKEGLSLFGIMNRTKSQLGSRMLRTWFQRPLKDAREIQSRHSTIAYLINPRNVENVTALEEAVKHMKNITKILTRMRTSQASVGDWQALYKTVYNATSLKEVCRVLSQSVHIFRKITETFSDDLHRITNYISKIVDFPESSLQSRFVVKTGVDEQLDHKKRIFSQLPEVMSKVAQEELNKLKDFVTECSVLYIPQIGYLLAIPESGITDLTKLGDNYGIEGLTFVFSSNNVYNYRSPATRDLDSMLGDTKCDITDMETAIMYRLQDIVLEHSRVLLATLDLAAELDCLLALAACAREYKYVRPTITEENVIEIEGGRHPIQELCCSTFVPNDVQSNSEYGRIKVLTGPNACGKSIYLKQVALIVFMAQIGSFVPAEEAHIGLVDRIYTRVRSLESVSVGLSTFMIDINQMSEALRNAGENSLCIVDEFGKGTDMIDGLAILCASIKHWVGQGTSCPHVLVSTHFHTMIQRHLLPRSPLIKYLTLETLENGVELVFLYQLVEGQTSFSYACHVAAQAGLPSDIVKRGIEVSELLRQCKPVQRVDTLDTDTQNKRCEAIVQQFLALDIETADIKAFLSQCVLPTFEGKL